MQHIRAELGGELPGGEAAGFGDDVEARGELGERALHRGQRAEDRRYLRRHREPVVGDDAEQVGEHAHVGGDPGGDVPGQEPAQHPLQARLVQLPRPPGHLQQRVGQPGRVAPV